MTAAGAEKVFAETASGTKTDRAQIGWMMKAIPPGDTVLVTRLDRLAGSTRDLLNILGTLGEQDVGFRSLADALAYTTTSHGRSMATMLGVLAEVERDLIRTTEGQKWAEARGARSGPKHKLTPFQQQEARARKDAGETVREIVRS